MHRRNPDVPLLEVKPSILNAFFPLFLKNILVYFVLFLFIYAAYTIVDAFALEFIPKNPGMLFFIFLAIIFAVIPLLVKTFILFYTTYKFFPEHVVSEFRFLYVKKKSAVYSRITSVDVRISVWDRLCNAGDIILHTGDDSAPDLKLQFITKPEEMEKKIYSLIKKYPKIKSKVAS